MFAAIFAAVTTLEVIFISKNDITLRAVVKIFRIQFFIKHDVYKDIVLSVIFNLNLA